MTWVSWPDWNYTKAVVWRMSVMFHVKNLLIHLFFFFFNLFSRGFSSCHFVIPEFSAALFTAVVLGARSPQFSCLVLANKLLSFLMFLYIWGGDFFSLPVWLTYSLLNHLFRFHGTSLCSLKASRTFCT